MKVPMFDMKYLECGSSMVGAGAKEFAAPPAQKASSPV